VNHPGDLLSAYLDGEVTRTEAEAVAAHLAACAPCRDEIDDLAAARTALRALPLVDPPPGLLPDAPVIRFRKRRWVWAAPAAAAAVALAVALALGGGAGSRLDLEDLAERHNVRQEVDPGIATFRSPGGSP
jgi:anti-sigma factor RsiW